MRLTKDFYEKDNKPNFNIGFHFGSGYRLPKKVSEQI
jgi:hypothetical protein